MKKQASLVIFIMSYFLSACTLLQNHEVEEVAPAVQESPPPAVQAKTSVLKKKIVDQDLKKNQDDKELKKRVVVLPFLDKQNTRDLTVLRNAHEAFIDSLNATDELIALDSSVLKIDLNKYIKDNTYDLKAIAKDSQTVGISCILEGRIIDMRFKDEDISKVDNSSSLKARAVAFEVVVQARMMNIRSEQELFNIVKTVSIEEENSKITESITGENFFNRNNELTELLIKDAFMDYNTKLVESLKYIIWEGRIAALQGDRIFINVGQISGVQVGDILKVVDDGSEIYDTELGYHLGKVPGKTKGTLEVVGFFGQDGAVSVIHSGAGFKENDRIELYQ
jgi:hypothetical protein